MSKEMRLSIKKNRLEDKIESTESKEIQDDNITENNSVNKMTTKDNNNNNLALSKQKMNQKKNYLLLLQSLLYF